MPTNKFKLTTASVKKRCTPPGPDDVTASGEPVRRKFYWDTELKGFGLIVQRTGTRTWVLQKDLNGKSKRVKIGRMPAWTPDAARKRAMELTVEMDKGGDPNERARQEKAKGTTLAEAIEWHQTAMRAKRCAERSIENIRLECERHLSDWLNRPLASITRNECARRHEKVTANGRYAANRALQVFRAVYNTALRRLEELPPCPTVGVTFNKTSRRREPITWTALPEWARAVEAVPNPIRRDLQLFLLFTGLRSTDARTTRWEDVNLGDEPKVIHGVEVPAGCIRRPRPKGGEDRAFTVPVAEVVLEILRRRRDGNGLIYPNDGGWVFPSKNIKGQVTYVAQAREQRYDGMGKKVAPLPTPHRLRDTFASAAHEARVHPMDLKILMNHRLAGGDDVTEGYIRPSTEHLRRSVEKIAGFLTVRMAEKTRK